MGEHNWPILRNIPTALAIPDTDTQAAMKWMYQQHGLKIEPSGAITIAAALSGQAKLDGDADIVFVVSGRNVDEDRFRDWISS